MEDQQVLTLDDQMCSAEDEGQARRSMIRSTAPKDGESQAPTTDDPKGGGEDGGPAGVASDDQTD